MPRGCSRIGLSGSAGRAAATMPSPPRDVRSTGSITHSCSERVRHMQPGFLPSRNMLPGQGIGSKGTSSGAENRSEAAERLARTSAPVAEPDRYSDLRFRAFQTDGSWYRAYWYEQPRPRRARMVWSTLAVLMSTVKTRFIEAWNSSASSLFPWRCRSALISSSSQSPNPVHLHQDPAIASAPLRSSRRLRRAPSSKR
jgi:hypothetical protein